MRCWCANISARASWASVFGAVSAFASLGMALGPVAGGWVFDTYHGYWWLHAGSFGIGMAAVAVALSFPSKKQPPQPSLDLATRDGLIARGGWATIPPRQK